MKRFILSLIAVFSCLGSFQVHAMDDGASQEDRIVTRHEASLTGTRFELRDAGDLNKDRPFKSSYIVKNIAWLIGAVTVFHYTNKALEEDRKAQEIEIAKKNIEDGFRDSIAQAEKQYNDEAKRQLAQRYYGVRMPNEKEIEQQVAEDRMLADAYRRELHEKAEREGAEAQAETVEEDIEPDSDGMSGDEEADHAEDIPADDDGSTDDIRDQQLAEYVDEVPDQTDENLVVNEEVPQPKELKPLSSWKRNLYKVLRAASIGMIVVQLTGLVTNLFAWYRGKAFNPGVWDRLEKDKGAVAAHGLAIRRDAFRWVPDDALPVGDIDTAAFRKLFAIIDLRNLVTQLCIKNEKITDSGSVVGDLTNMQNETLHKSRTSKLAIVLRSYLGLPYWAAKTVDCRVTQTFYRKDQRATSVAELIAQIHRAARENGDR